jgi:hypothetical protein
MHPCPRFIGNAKVVWYTTIDHRHAPTGNTRHSINGFKLGPSAALAICRYEDHDGGFYLFACDKNWEPESDTWHESVEQAKDQAEFEYTGTTDTWIRASE